MSVKSLSNISSIATERTNTANELTPILEVNPDNGTTLALLMGVARGEGMGIPIYAKLRSGANTQLPEDSRLALGFETPQDDQVRVVSEPLHHIRAYRALSLVEQQNTDFIGRVKHHLKSGSSALVAEDVDTVYVLVDSSAQISWSDSSLTFEENAVRER